MRGIVQFQVTQLFTIYALDEDGILWVGERHPGPEHDGSYGCEWVAIAGPADTEPFQDRRSRLDIIEENIREAERQRAALPGAKEGEIDPRRAGGNPADQPGNDQPYGDGILGGESGGSGVDREEGETP